MRCPKCHYLSFEPEPRCKNCGYDFFALTDGDLLPKTGSADSAPAGSAPLEKEADSGATPKPPADRVAPAGEAAAAVAVDAERPRPLAPPRPVAPRPGRPPSTSSDLPLFMRTQAQAGEPDAAVVPAPPRPPLSVRRRTGDPAASGSPAQARPGTAAAAGRKPTANERDVLGDAPINLPAWATVAPRKTAEPLSPEVLAQSAASVSGIRRAISAMVDAVILIGIDAGVVWLTLRLCSLSIGEAADLPMVPLFVFFVLLDLGYLLLFTATSGQTVGKMATRLRVVGTSAAPLPGPPVTIGQAFLRAIVSVPSGLVLGAGLLPALLGRGPAVHDRIAHTRVIPE